MKVYPYQLVTVAGLGFISGILVAAYFTVAPLLLGVAGLLFLSALVLRPQAVVKVVSIFALGLLLGWWRYGVAVDLPENLVSNWSGQTVMVEGVVGSDPEHLNGNQEFQLRAQLVDDQPAAGKILVTTWSLAEYQYGDQLKAQIHLEQPSVYEDFDYATYLAKSQIYSLGEVKGEIVRSDPARFSMLRVLYQVKHWLAAIVNRLLPEPHSALLNGLLLGLRTQLPDSMTEDLKFSGTTHIIALSGFNITIIAAFFMYLLRSAPRRLGLSGAAVGILIFVLMTGASSSVVRAAIMGWILLLAGIWGRRRSVVNAVILAAVAMLMINPLVLQHDIGFQLSIAATVGLIYLAPRFLQLLRVVPRYLREVLATTLGATIATLPLIVFHFGGFSTISLLANAAIVPIVPVVMLVGFVGVVLYAIFPLLHLLALPVAGCTGLLIHLITFFGNLPHSFVEVTQVSPLFPVIYYILLVALLYVWSPQKHSAAPVR